MVRTRRLHEAAWAYAEVLAVERKQAAVWLEYSSVLRGLEDHRAAVTALDRALRLCPELASAWNDRGVSLVALRRDVEARQSFERALRLRPRFAPASTNLANLALEVHDSELAIRLYREALTHDVKHVVARIGLGRALLLAGRVADAERELEQARRLAPMTFEVLLAHVALHVGQGRVAEATQSCRRFLRISPQHSGARGLWLELLREQGDESACEQVSFERWVQVHDLGVEQAFNDGLVARIVEAPSLLHAPPHHATRSGLHSGALSGLEHDGLGRLEAIIEAQLSAYFQQRAHDPVWSGSRPEAVALHSWAVVLEGGGFQLPHLHPEAWLSGVYYAAVPELPGSSHAGHLEFGRVDPELGLTRARPSHFVEPKPGRLVLFPSWLYHSTIPHGGSGLRVSLAFDCVRAA